MIKNQKMTTQKELGSIILDGDEETICTAGGAHVWVAAFTGERQAFWKALWNTYPLPMAQHMFACFDNVIYFPTIFGARTREKFRWAKFTKSMFVYFCEQTYVLRVYPEDSQAKAHPDMRADSQRYKVLYDRWRAFPKSIHARLGLTPRNIPVVATGLSGAHKRQKVTTQLPGDEVMVAPDFDILDAMVDDPVNSFYSLTLI